MLNQIYSGTFSNKSGIFPIKMSNNFKELSFKTGDLTWIGEDFDGFRMMDSEQISDDVLNKFDFQKIKIYNPENDDSFVLELINYKLAIQIPQIIIEIESKKERKILLNFELELNKSNQESTISFKIDEILFIATSDFLEGIFDKLQHQFKGRFRFKNCYGCTFGDYSVYGTGFIGPILCFKNQKQAYLNVQHKTEYMDLEPWDSKQQEFFCCDNYEVRIESLGYRGTVK